MTESFDQVAARFVEVGGYLVHPDQIAETFPGGVVLTDGRRLTREGITE